MCMKQINTLINNSAFLTQSRVQCWRFEMEKLLVPTQLVFCWSQLLASTANTTTKIRLEKSHKGGRGQVEFNSPNPNFLQPQERAIEPAEG